MGLLKMHDKQVAKEMVHIKNKRRFVFVLILIGILAVALLISMAANGCISCGSCDCGACFPSSSDVSGGDVSGADMPADDYYDDNADRTAADASDSDVSGSDAKGGLFSSCSGRQTDDEAGGSTEKTGGGFLGFLFSCGGRSCYESCNSASCVSFTDLTDPIDGGDRTTSGGDIYTETWESQNNDHAYIDMMRTNTQELMDHIMSLSALRSSLSQYRDTDRVRNNEQYKKLSDEILNWCNAAQSYDKNSLETTYCKEVWKAADELAEHLKAYLNVFPEIVCGQYPPQVYVDPSDSDAVVPEYPTEDELFANVSDSIIYLHQLIEQFD